MILIILKTFDCLCSIAKGLDFGLWGKEELGGQAVR
jgi:hypothetical protein